MKTLRNLFVMGALVLSLTGCATIFGGSSTETLNVTSNIPMQVKLTSDTGVAQRFTTPFTTEIQRKENYSLRVQANGYESETILVSRSVRPLAVFNLTLPLGWGIDYSTGKMWRHKMLNVNIDTNDLDKKSMSNEDQIKVKLSLELSGNDKDQDAAEMIISKDVIFNKV